MHLAGKAIILTKTKMQTTKCTNERITRSALRKIDESSSVTNVNASNGNKTTLEIDLSLGDNNITTKCTIERITRSASRKINENSSEINVNISSGSAVKIEV